MRSLNGLVFVLSIQDRCYNADYRFSPSLRIAPMPRTCIFQPGQSFDRYRIDRLVGEGSMGAVYLATDTRLRRQVAIKIPLIDLDDKEALARFEREAQIAARLSHPHLCALYDFGVIDGQPYLIMEYVEGTLLSQRVGAQHLWNPAEAVLLIHTLARAMHKMHQKDALHRDLKPDNIMLTADGPKIMDFGLAFAVNCSTQLTPTGSSMGTPAYMPLELFRGDTKLIGPATDVYSLGVILYELLTGVRPINASNISQLYAKLQAEEPIPPSVRRSNLPPSLDAICLKALAKQACDRFPNMVAFATALQETQLVSSSDSLSGLEVVAVPSPPVAPPSSPQATMKMKAPVPANSQALTGTRVTARPAQETLPDTLVAPFPAEQALAGQKAWARFLNVPLEQRNSLGMRLVLIPPGEFPMGSPVNEEGRGKDEPQHLVRITQPFLVATMAVTQADYVRIMGQNPSWFQGNKASGPTERLPVEKVSWFDAVLFCNRLSEQEGLKPCYVLVNIVENDGTITAARASLQPSTDGYRLLTEAEWEYVCRAGSAAAYAFGKDLQPTQANFDRSRLNRPVLVASYPANAFGLYDLHGNVWEWCWDWYGPYDGAPIDPQGPGGGSLRVTRGGRWSSPAADCRSAKRDGVAPGSRNGSLGFRVARALRVPG